MVRIRDFAPAVLAHAQALPGSILSPAAQDAYALTAEAGYFRGSSGIPLEAESPQAGWANIDFGFTRWR